MKRVLHTVSADGCEKRARRAQQRVTSLFGGVYILHNRETLILWPQWMCAFYHTAVTLMLWYRYCMHIRRYHVINGTIVDWTCLFFAPHMSFNKYRAVGVAASVRAERPGIRTFAMASEFSLRQIVQISSVFHWVSFSMNTGILSLAVKWPGRETDHLQ